MELGSSSQKPLLSWMRTPPVILQLQFLPLLYAGPNDQILVSDLPENPDPRLRLIESSPEILPINHWGPSLAISKWAATHHIPYEILPWDLIKKINSKIFSFNESPKLPKAKLLQSQEELTSWIQNTPGPKVLKTPFGTAGRGHFFVKENIKQQYNTPLIGEPWVDRVLDFSTQWLGGKLIGVTLFENEPNGTYLGTYAGDVESWALKEHLDVAEPLVQKIFQMGYSDHLGIDAFIYQINGKRKLHPVGEINARKTMSWVALQLPQKRLFYTKCSSGLLPNRLGKYLFSRNLTTQKMHFSIT